MLSVQQAGRPCFWNLQPGGPYGCHMSGRPAVYVPPAFLDSRRPNRGVRPPRCVVEGEHSAAGISGVLRSERDARPPRVFGPQMRERWCRWGGQGRSLIFDDRGAGLPPRLTGLGGTLRRLWRLLGCMLNFCFIMVTFIRRLSCEHLFCCCTVFVVC